MIGRHGRELPLDLEPDRHRVNADGVPRKARDEHVRPLGVVKCPTKHRGDLESALLVDPSRGAAAKALLVHLGPQKSTRIVRRAPSLVNASLSFTRTYARFSP